jgi:predicted ATPase
MSQLESITIKEFDREDFPFNLPLVKKLPKLSFKKPVTFFIGENGSGKSTIIEAIATGVGLPAIGSQDLVLDETLNPALRLSEYLKFSWKIKSKRGFFLRAEDFFGFVKRLHKAHAELDADIKHYEATLEGEGLSRARGAALAQKNAMTGRYGEDLNANSHGESFLKLFQSRFTQTGLYILDEPEASLSPQRQLTLISMIKNMVEEKKSQFIIATHSPILMAIPGSTIYEFKDGEIREIKYQETEHYSLTKSFLNNPENFLRHL